MESQSPARGRAPPPSGGAEERNGTKRRLRACAVAEIGDTPTVPEAAGARDRPWRRPAVRRPRAPNHRKAQDVLRWRGQPGCRTRTFAEPAPPAPCSTRRSGDTDSGAFSTVRQGRRGPERLAAGREGAARQPPIAPRGRLAFQVEPPPLLLPSPPAAGGRPPSWSGGVTTGHQPRRPARGTREPALPRNFVLVRLEWLRTPEPVTGEIEAA